MLTLVYRREGEAKKATAPRAGGKINKIRMLLKR